MTSVTILTEFYGPGMVPQCSALEHAQNMQNVGGGGATGRTGEDTSPPVLFKVNFLICPNPVRKMGGGVRL